MTLFTESELATARIENAVYDEHSECWDITVRHNDIAYTVLTYELGHPDEVMKEEIAYMVQKIMLTMENKSVPKVEVKRKFNVDLASVPNVDLGLIDKYEVKPIDQKSFLVYNKIGDESFFSESSVLEKGNVHVILNKQKMAWEFGRYNQNEGWFKGDQIVRVNGRRVRLYESDGLKWEYMEELPQDNILVLNQIVTRDMVMEGAYSKYRVHMNFNIDQFTWEYGPDNEDDGWLGEGRQINYQGYKLNIKSDFTFSLF